MVLGSARMALRSFVSRDGATWTAWQVRAETTTNIPGTPAEWLAFQSADGTERRRLLEVPDGWDQLPDDRLDLLRRMAEPVTLLASRHSPPGGVQTQAPTTHDSTE
jgi:hypothetical protein